jgi:Xaa-Pro aminopeptidase
VNKSQQKAVRVADRIINDLKVRAGQSELEIAALIRSRLKAQGARPAFRIIVASGRRSALPHGFATARKIRAGDQVVIDFGALYNGYRSDITRTVIVGKPSAKQKKIYRIVRQAQARAIKAVRAGRACCDVDRAARTYIEQQGFGRCFVHSTGHGVGRMVHQPPKISKRNRRRLREGMVLAVEPGIYIRGWGGIRIEDMVQVTQKGCRILTRAKK